MFHLYAYFIFHILLWFYIFIINLFLLLFVRSFFITTKCLTHLIQCVFTAL